ncbi:hypothetical protein [Primorskyibacter sedentarius]|uniref:hypothetical protein n=1 Tax=Primorskyibacter sedentarius TaxID=745311 RepID=UPI003EBF46E9
MDTDLYLVIGCLLVVIAIPRAVAALADLRKPVFSLLLFLVGCGLVFYGHTQVPGGYTFADVPNAFARVIGGWLN